MIFNPVVVSSGGMKFKFTYNPGLTTGDETLNGNPISAGDVVELEAGSENYLYSPDEMRFIITDSGFVVPMGDASMPQTRAAPTPLNWRSFVMPNENCEFKY